MSGFSDLMFRTLKRDEKKLVICFLSTLIDKTGVDDHILEPLQENRQTEWSIEEIVKIIPLADLEAVNQIEEIVAGLIEGKTYIYPDGQPCGLLANVSKSAERGLAKAETESLVYGPKNGIKIAGSGGAIRLV